MALLFGRPVVLRRSARSSEVAAICCRRTCMDCALDVGTCTPGASCRCLLQMEHAHQGCPVITMGGLVGAIAARSASREPWCRRAIRSKSSSSLSPPHEPAHEARAACRRQPEREAEVRRRDGRSLALTKCGIMSSASAHTHVFSRTQERASVRVCCRGARVSFLGTPHQAKYGACGVAPPPPTATAAATRANSRLLRRAVMHPAPSSATTAVRRLRCSSRREALHATRAMHCRQHHLILNTGPHRAKIWSARDTVLFFGWRQLAANVDGPALAADRAARGVWLCGTVPRQLC